MSDRLVTTKVSIHDTIKQTQLRIFKIKTQKKANKEKLKLAAANMDSNLFCRLFIACTARKGNIDEFFMHENNRYPPSLSEFGRLRKSPDNDSIVNCLSKPTKVSQSVRSKTDTTVIAAVTPTVPEITASAFIMDAFAHVQFAYPADNVTVGNYSRKIFNELVDSKRDNYDRVDVLFDTSPEKSLEELTDETCTIEKYVSWIDNETTLQKGKVQFAKLLSKSKVKTQFLKLLATNYLQDKPSLNNDLIFGTDQHIIISKNETSDVHFLLPIENMNARMLLHVEHAVQNGHQEILLSTSDYNIVIVAIYSFRYLMPNLKKLWIELLDNNNSNIVSIHELYEKHKDKSDALPFFHAFTGYKTTSKFFGIGKTTAWNAWMNFPSVTSAMLTLCKDVTSNLSNEAMDVLEHFTIKMYDSTSKLTRLHECRRELFTRKVKSRPIDRIPPTRDALEQHVKRSILQSNIWSQCLRSNIAQIDPSDWGWIVSEQTAKYTPYWISTPIVADHCKELIACKCRSKKCTGNCKCFKNQLPCTMLCVCDGLCESKFAT